MGRFFVIIAGLSGLGFLLCLLINPGSYTFYTMVPFPNERTPWPSNSQLYLMAIQQNPWVAMLLALLLTFVVSSIFGVFLLVAGKTQKQEP